MDFPANESVVLAWEALPEGARVRWQAQISRVNLPPLLRETAAAGLNLDNYDPRLLAAMAGRDPVLAAKLLAVANSAKFGLTMPMTSVQRAVVHLGFNLVKTIMLAYQFEAIFGKLAALPRDYLDRIRRWSSCAAVIAFHWGQASDVSDPSTASTAALLTRLGTLLLAVGQPQFSEGYWQQPDEPARLRYEAAVCSITTLALSQRLAQQWGLPESLQTLIFRQWEPVEQVLEPSYTARTLSLIAAANALAERVVDNPSITAGEVIDQTAYNTLKANLATNRLLDDLHGVWISVRLQRELSVCLE